ncbi:glycosyltransferase [Microbulbifer spongiae]|uniref:Glycosyltransferase n=1 Tax=Microbulbifer spongiae TaxID=2944933 RepID=A0ABY9EJK3_9GAMM|nr:glycosyltransferase [Microbulbifer sp. MI-G]WKD51456.1 glycosyltransferase [Microbulbifer sp. MI-G]
MNSSDSREALERELAALQVEYHRVLESNSFRLGRLLIEATRSPLALLRLPITLINFFRTLRRQSRPPGPGSIQYEMVRKQWLSLVEEINKSGSKELVFLFSGTTCIQGTRGNRPIRQAQALLARGVPVFFSYHRTRFTESLPVHNSVGLVQSPVDITLQLLNDISAVSLGDIRKLFIISYPFEGIESYVDKFRSQGWSIIYDCRDDWEEFAKVGMAKWFHAEVERKLVATVDRTYCVSRPLVDKLSLLVPDSCVKLMPNAVGKDIIPNNYKHEPALFPRVVGYFGHLSAAWFNWEAFKEIVQLLPQYQFEVIGHSAPSEFELPENVLFLGPRPWQELHRYATRWSAGIIPFRMGRLADGVDPIKIYEYLAFGLPVVSFVMPQISDYPYTTTVSTVEEFCCALKAACEEVPKHEIIEAFLTHNTWEARAEELLSIFGDPVS